MRRPSALFIVLIGALVTVVIGAGVCLGVLRESPPLFPDNAVWLGVTWVKDPHVEEEVTLLGRHLSEYSVRYVYVYVSWFRNDTNTWNPTCDHARGFVQTLRQAAPEVRILGWLGVPSRSTDGTYRLGSEIVRRRVAQFAQRSVEQFGFDGVHINVESVFDDNEDFPLLLQEVRDLLGSEVLLSVAVPPDWNPGRPEVPAGPNTDVGMVWSQAYKQEVGALVDQMAVMAYNSGLETSTDYEAWVSYQVEQFSAALADVPSDVELIVGVPTYADELGHDCWVENLRAALNGVHDGLRRAGSAASVVAGVGLYAFWDTDAVEWALYRQMWLRAR